jgi:PiT family inorganic phosphate transporter
MATATPEITADSPIPERGKRSPAQWGIIAAGVMFVAGIIFVGTRIARDLSGVHNASFWPFALLGLALTIALGFEFVNGFHDTANAVATVIYTHSLEPHFAVLWSGTWNFIGVLLSSGGVAYTIITLLPVELILQVGYGAGFAMVFALLIAAILWNLGTWWLGLPASSSHTMIGSIIGVGLANQFFNAGSGHHTSGVDWSQVTNVFKVLLISPVVGFVFSGLLLLLMKTLVKDPALYEAPKGKEPPPFWIRCMLILTCTGVSFGHGSNDGQKGMGLIMLILIGTVPTAYALNHAVGPNQLPDFVASSQQAINVMSHAQVAGGATENPAPQAVAPVQGDTNGANGGEVERFISERKVSPATPAAVADLMKKIEQEVSEYKALKNVPADQQRNVRNDMYLESEALRVMGKIKNPNFSAADTASLDGYRKHLDTATKFIPTWVKVAVALALGMGTMIGWKRIVVTVGEKIGKTHLTYAQGMSAEIIAASTIILADQFKMPVSTTHVLSSGVAGTMAANKSGLQWDTLRNIAMAWVLTLPSAALLSACLFWAFRQIF